MMIYEADLDCFGENIRANYGAIRVPDGMKRLVEFPKW